jgi:hypothetical protein
VKKTRQNKKLQAWVKPRSWNLSAVNHLSVPPRGLTHWLFTSTIEDLDRDQIDRLLAGKARLTVVGPTQAKEMEPPTVLDQTEILAKLNDCKDRDQAREILETIRNRESLAALARKIKVHVVKHDRREDIESKIIEFMIGGKLRTEAIRSLNLKGGMPPRSDENQ